MSRICDYLVNQLTVVKGMVTLSFKVTHMSVPRKRNTHTHRNKISFSDLPPLLAMASALVKFVILGFNCSSVMNISLVPASQMCLVLFIGQNKKYKN